MAIKQYSVPPPTVWEHQACIDPSLLEVGHFVSRLDCPWSETPFLLEGVLIDEPKVRHWLMTHCAWVVIDLERSRNKHCPPTYTLAPGFATGLDKKPISHPINTLRRVSVDRRTLRFALQGYKALNRQTHRLLDAFASNGRLDVVSAREAVNGLSSALEKNLSAMVWLTRIKHQDQYTAEHCINVAVLSMGLAHALEWEQERIELAGLSGLLHDLGKMKVDLTILNKPGRLTPEEFEHLKTHSRLGYDMLVEDGDVPPEVTRAVLDHHERPDGHGYPSGKPGHKIPELAALVAVVDAYDAITSHRIYDAARSHHEALSILWQQRGTQFDQAMVEVFIQFMGWVTPGTLVELSSGETAVVTQAKMGQRLRPVVKLLTKTESGYLAGEEINLAVPQRSSEQSPGELVHIAKVLPDGFDGIDLKEISIGLMLG